MSKISKRVKYIFLIDIIVLLICLLGLNRNYNKAGINADHHIVFEWINNRVEIANVLDSALASTFKKGDIVHKIAGYQILIKNDIEFILDSYSIGDEVTVEVIRDGQYSDFKIRLPTYYSLLSKLLQSIISIIFLILGAFTFYNRPDYDAAVIWHWASVGTAVMISCTWGQYTMAPFATGYFLKIIFYAAYSYMPAAFLHLSLIFPQHKTKYLKKILYPVYTLVVILFLAQSITWFMAVNPISLENHSWFIAAFNFNRVFFAIAIFAGIGAYIHSYISAQEQYQKRQVRWLLLGLAVGPPFFVLFWQIPQLLSYNTLISEEFLVLIMLAVPVTFYIAIIKHHIFDIDLVISRSTVYLIVVFLLFVIYGSLVGLAFLLLGKLDIESSLISTVAAAILTPILFEPARRFFRNVVNKAFFRVKYNYRLAQRRFTIELDKIVDKKAVANLVITQIDDLLQLEYIAFYLHDKALEKWRLMASKDFSEIRKDIVDDLFKIIQKTNTVILTSSYNIESGIEFEKLDKHENEDIRKCMTIPFKNHEFKTLGVIILGAKKSAKKFNLEDIDLLKTISIHVGLAIDKINLQEQLIFKNIEAEQLRELNRLKSYFVSSVSHELQTPLTSIKMFAELLSSKSNIPEKKKHEYLQIIQGESDRLSRLISMVLDFSKIERGVKVYHLEKINLNNIIINVMKSMNYQFEQYGFKTEYKNPSKDVVISGDNDALISTFTNILSNSIKYSDKTKEITVKLNVKDDIAVLSFTDKGIGIKQEDQPRVFDTFFRSDENKIQSMGGAGLGLTVVRHVIEAHKAKIEVESTTGKGSTFILTFPLYSENDKEDL